MIVCDRALRSFADTFREERLSSESKSLLDINPAQRVRSIWVVGLALFSFLGEPQCDI
jgi:hypothetical protein